MRRLLGIVSIALGIATAPVRPAVVQDDTGHSVALPRPAQRIVTLAPHATELVVTAGAAARLVAAAPGPGLPAGFAGLPRLGGPGGLDREALLAQRPDLVIGWQSGNRAADLDWIAGSGITLYRSEPRSLADIAAAIRAIGELSGTSQAAGPAADEFERTIQTPCAGLPSEPAFLIVWQRPAMSVGGRHWLNDVLRAAGYRNVYSDVDRGVFQISPEALQTMRPATEISLFPTASGDQRRLAELLSRPGPRLGEAVQALCRRRLEPAGARSR